MTEDERVVRDAWAEVRSRIIARSISVAIWVGTESKEFWGWPAARAFTEERLKQIAEVEEEIAFLEKRVRPHWPIENDISWVAADAKRLTRIIAAREAVLADLKRGTK